MKPLFAIAYVSSATGELSVSDLEMLLLNARDYNARAQITGVLLYHDGSFFQYLEGPQTEVEAAYARIKTAHQHHGLIQLLHRNIEARHFETWKMGFSQAPKSFILKLSQVSWVQDVAQEANRLDTPIGIKLLLEFWHKATRAG